MEEHLYQFEYSKYFNYLLYLGCWTYNTKNIHRWRFFMAYRMICFVIFLTSWFLQAIDLWRVTGNIEKMTYNLSTSTIVVGTTSKVILLLRKTQFSDDLRRRLWKDYYRFNNERYNAFKEEAHAEMVLVAKLFHVTFVVFYPICMLLAYFSYHWGPRELPFPAYAPINTDESVIGYNLAFGIQFAFGIPILFVAIETDLIVFSLVLQLSIQYKTLSSDIIKINELYSNDEDAEAKGEISRTLRNMESEKILKKIVKRQITLAKYCKLFEDGFNEAFIIQILGGSILLIMNGIQFVKMTQLVNQKLLYETVYFLMIVADVFFNCLYLTMLTAQCNSLGDTAYSTAWYKMDAYLQKYILMMIIQAQKSPKFTAGKLVTVDLNTFLLMLRNTYSWLMLFRQIEMK